MRRAHHRPAVDGPQGQGVRGPGRPPPLPPPQREWWTFHIGKDGASGLTAVFVAPPRSVARPPPRAAVERIARRVYGNGAWTPAPPRWYREAEAAAVAHR